MIASLSPEAATEVWVLILKPPSRAIQKPEGTADTAASEQHRLQQLFNTEELGDRKSTQLLGQADQSQPRSKGLDLLINSSLHNNTQWTYQSTTKPMNLCMVVSSSTWGYRCRSYSYWQCRELGLGCKPPCSRNNQSNSQASLSSCHLLYVTDRSNHLTFLIDTGAEVSVLPPSALTVLVHKKTSDFRQSMATYGKWSLTLNLGLWWTFRWIFIITDVQKPILGADFLCHFGLLVDIQYTSQCQCLLVQGSSPTPSLFSKIQLWAVLWSIPKWDGWFRDLSGRNKTRLAWKETGAYVRWFLKSYKRRY